MAKGRKREERHGAPEWIVTFSDLMSLLLTFFVLLLSFSTISEKDFKDAIASVQGALGVLPMHQGILSPVPAPPRRRTEQTEAVARRLRRQLQILGLEQQVKIEFDAVGGLKISLPAGVLFDPGSATLRPDSLPVLRDLGGILKEFPDSFVEVRGHTDSSPLTAPGPYRDNYDLSYHRAYAVFEQLAGPGRVPEEQFEITAAGGAQPEAPNDTEEGRRANRRVEVYVRGLVDRQKLDSLRSELPGTEPDGPPAVSESEP